MLTNIITILFQLEFKESFTYKAKPLQHSRGINMNIRFGLYWLIGTLVRSMIGRKS